MKRILMLMILAVASNSHAYSTQDTFNCLNGDEVNISSSLIPTNNQGQFERVYSAQSLHYGTLTEQDCSQLDSQWKRNGAENCYANEAAVFSFFGQLGQLGKLATLVIIKNQETFFTICHQIDSIQ